MERVQMLKTVSIAAARIALRASAKVLAASAQESREQLLKGQAAFGGWQQGKPGVRRLFTLQDLPPIGESTPSFSEVVLRPAGAKPQVPADLVASGLAESLAIRTAPNGDLFVADSSANVVRVFRAPAGSAKPARGAVFAGGLYQPYGITIYPLEPNPEWVYIAKCRARNIPGKGGLQTWIKARPLGATWDTEARRAGVLSADRLPITREPGGAGTPPYRRLR
jgi:hypothetical protein